MNDPTAIANAERKQDITIPDVLPLTQKLFDDLSLATCEHWHGARAVHGGFVQESSNLFRKRQFLTVQPPNVTYYSVSNTSYGLFKMT